MDFCCPSTEIHQRRREGRDRDGIGACHDDPVAHRKRRIAPAWAALAAITIVIAGGCSTTAAPGRRLPVLDTARIAYDGDVGDPSLLKVGTGGQTQYYLYGTDDWPSHIPTATSTDLTTWREGPDALPVLPAWANPDLKNSLTWAPTALPLGGGYLLYVTVQELSSRRQCIAVTASAVAAGPFRDAIGKPLVCQVALGGSIDPSVAREPSGALHLTWKSDGNCCGLPTSLWEQDLSDDGLALVGSAHKLLTARQPWQGGIVENPALLPATGGGWWLFYSGNQFDLAAYGTGLAYCPTLRGPCRETSTHPFLTGSHSQFSPGGLDFFEAAGGQVWAAFATWSRPPRNGRFYCCRPVSAARVLEH